MHVHTSPHLLKFNERIRLAGRIVDDAVLLAALEVRKANAGAPITFSRRVRRRPSIFAETPADWLLLEVGLGGRFDSTNVVEHPAASVVTPVSFDHAEFLGDTIESIASEKGGIFKRGAQGDWLAVRRCVARAEGCARRAGAPCIVAERDFDVREENGRLIFEDERGLLDLPPPRLAGRHQYQNAATAIATLRAIAPDIPASAFDAAMKSVDWPAPATRLSRGPLVEGRRWRGNLDRRRPQRGMARASRRPPWASAAALSDARSFSSADCWRRRTPAPISRNSRIWPIASSPFRRRATITGAPPMWRRPRAISACSRARPRPSRRLFVRSEMNWRKPPRILVCGSLYLAGAALAANGPSSNSYSAAACGASTSCVANSAGDVSSRISTSSLWRNSRCPHAWRLHDRVVGFQAHEADVLVLNSTQPFRT